MIKFFEREYKILKNLIDSPKYADELASLLAIPSSTIYSWIEEMKEKGYLSVKEEIYKKINLTEEGKRYAKIGLPERRLALFLKENGPSRIDDLKKHFSEKELEIAIMHALNKKMVEYKEGYFIFKSLTEYEDEKILKEINSKGEIITKEINKHVSSLKKRGLIEINEYKRSLVIINEEIANSIKSNLYELIPEKSRITSEDIISGTWKNFPLKPYNLEALPPRIYFGRSHPYMRFLEEVKKILLEMGFEEFDWDYILPELWNFDILFVPQDHPARDVHDTFRIRSIEGDIDEDLASKIKEMHENSYKEALGWKYEWKQEIAMRLILRTHTTPVSIRYIYTNKDKEAKVFCISRNFRRDMPDKTHFIEFYQCEGIMIGKDLNFSNLLAFFKEFASRLGLEKVRFKPSYFPFTEPSVEGSVFHEKLGWIEALPGGMFRPEITKMLGISSRVLAWGIGIDRLAMASLGLDDIRDLFSKDLEFLRTYPIL